MRVSTRHRPSLSVGRTNIATSSAPRTANAYCSLVNDDAITIITAYDRGTALRSSRRSTRSSPMTTPVASSVRSSALLSGHTKWTTSATADPTTATSPARARRLMRHQASDGSRSPSPAEPSPTSGASSNSCCTS